MVNIGTKYEQIQKYAAVLEKNEYEKIIEITNNSWKTNPLGYFQFYEWIYDYNIYFVLSEHKVALAKLLAEASKVDAYEEDRTRIVFLLARFAGTKNLKAVNEAFSEEFGPYFKIFKYYSFNDQKKLSWQDLANRAKEIKRGLMNFCYLFVKDRAEVSLNFYNNFTERDTDKLEKMVKMAEEIAYLVKDKIDLSPRAPEMAEAAKKIEEFYKLTNRIELDIEEVSQKNNFRKIMDYVLKIHSAAEIRLKYINRKMTVDETTFARKALLTELGKSEWDELIGYEIMRIGVPLRPVSQPVLANK